MSGKTAIDKNMAMAGTAVPLTKLGSQSSAIATGRSAALQNFVWLTADKIVAILVGLFVFGLIARTYGPAASGHFAYAAALLQTALGLAQVCSAAAILPRLCRQSRGQLAIVSNVFLVRVVGSFLASMIVAAYVLFTVQEPERLFATLLLLLCVPLIEPFFAIASYWQSRNENRAQVISRCAGLIARAIAVILAIALKAPVWILALAWLLESLLSALLLSRSLKPVASFAAMKRAVSEKRVQMYFKFGVRFLAGLWLSHLFLRMDRLVMAELMPAHDFGIYATSMQLVEVWLQVATIAAISLGPAFLYAQLAKPGPLRQYARVSLALAGLGVAGLLATIWLGKPALALIFGTDYTQGYSYLVAGAAFGVLFFADQVVALAISAANRPVLLAVRWGVACAVALAVQLMWFGSFGAFAGPIGLACGLVASWLLLIAVYFSRPRAVDMKGAA
ncbi:MAG: lipopolysaccharide biosynthesis protein [Burkholderiaceae bacterium]